MGNEIKSIIGGCYQIIDDFFELKDIGQSPHFDRGGSYKRLANAPRNDLDFFDLISNLYKQLERNRDLSITAYGKPPSRKNWRFESQTNIDPDNTSPEVTLERRLVNAFEGTLVNQVPTSSGLVGSRQDKVRNIDLVLKNTIHEYEFIELKVGSNTPLYAAFEILLYGLLYLFTREHLKKLDYDSKDKDLLTADTIHLITLAPYNYYSRNIYWIENKINDGLQQYIESEIETNLIMDFKFQSFPKEFEWPVVDNDYSDDELVHMMNNRFNIYQ